MNASWKDSIYRQREELARLLREPIDKVAEQCIPEWGDRERLEQVLVDNFASIPNCAYLYVLDTNGIQLTESINRFGIAPGHYLRDRSRRPYMNEVVPAWGFLLSDAYISLHGHRPSLTALQIIRDGRTVRGYLGADFDLRDLPVTAELYQEPQTWRQVKGDPAIRSLLFQQTRIESPMDRDLAQAFSILEELLTQRGVFQCQIQFASSQAMIWMMDDPFRYRILDHEALTDPDICLVYPLQCYPIGTRIPQESIASILENFGSLRLADENIYLRQASINLLNGMISLTFSCDGSHYMSYDEFLNKNINFWFGGTQQEPHQYMQN
ncbi:MAG: PDC sensor domain-containing protein [Gammaproteobacteria bacterium]